MLNTDYSALLNKISSYVCEAIIAIQEQQAEIFLEKYRNVNWRNSRNQSGLTGKLTEVLSQTQDWDALVQELQRFLKALFIPESLNSPILIELVEKVRQLNSVKPELNGSVISKKVEFTEKVMPAASTTSLQQTGIAVLLLSKLLRINKAM